MIEMGPGPALRQDGVDHPQGGRAVDTNAAIPVLEQAVAEEDPSVETRQSAVRRFDACDRAMQTLGGYGYSQEYHVERLWRDVRLFRLAPLAQELILGFVGQHVLGMPKTY